MPAKKPRPLATTSLKIRGRHRLVIRIWKNRSAVALGGAGQHRAYSGLYSSEWRQSHKKGRASKWRGELSIDLALPRVGAALWAHELQHFMVDWCAHMEWD